MDATERRALIEQRVRSTGEVLFAELADEFRVSEMTIRRDVDSLEDAGVLRKVIGGAIVVGKDAEPPFATRVSRAADEKRHIARAVVQHLRHHETVVLDSGSTVLAVAREIKGMGLELTVVTPSLLVATELADDPGTTVLVTGGQVRPSELSLVGPDAAESFGRYNCDTFVMGVAGVDSLRGVTDYHREEGWVKIAASRAVDRVIVAADHTKMGRVQLVQVSPLNAVSILVTDAAPDDATVVAAGVVGVAVHCVEDEAPARPVPVVN